MENIKEKFENLLEFISPSGMEMTADDVILMIWNSAEWNKEASKRSLDLEASGAKRFVKGIKASIAWIARPSTSEYSFYNSDKKLSSVGFDNKQINELQKIVKKANIKAYKTAETKFKKKLKDIREDNITRGGEKEYEAGKRYLLSLSWTEDSLKIYPFVDGDKGGGTGFHDEWAKYGMFAGWIPWEGKGNKDSIGTFFIQTWYEYMKQDIAKWLKKQG